MAFKIIMGLDRTGKSTIAEFYRKQGYIVHHMSAPNKKYFDPSYIGPSYMDECLEMYMKYSGQNVVFDRTIYGELIWSAVYGRAAQLTEDDIDMLREIESNNEAEYIYMYDTDKAAHWQRCVDNKEPLNKSQFMLAYKLYDKVATQYNFTRTTLPEFNKINSISPITVVPKIETPVIANPPIEKVIAAIQQNTVELHHDKLKHANIINDLLAGRILKKKSAIHDVLENELRGFLMNKLNDLLGIKTPAGLTEIETKVLKTMAQRIIEKGDLK
jgi:hypothetical protein